MSKSSDLYPRLMAGLVLLIALGWWAHEASVGWEYSGLSGHEFRQAQTALTIQTMAREGFRPDYSTPVLGKPWSIPMEFPLYQYAVVQWQNATGMELAQAGRSVALLAFLGGLPAIFGLLRRLGLSAGAAALGLVPVIFAPVHLFYARTVMIESAAWCMSAWFLWAIFRLREREDVLGWSVVGVAGTMAVLIKPTTWAVFCIPWALVFLADAGKAWRTSDRPRMYALARQACLIGVPLLVIGFGWVAWADAVKRQNPMAHFLLSSELRSFNFGTWAMRVDREMLIALATSWHRFVAPWWVVLPAVGLAVMTRRGRQALLWGGSAFVGIQAIFFNLYLLHDYYFFANAVFLAGMVGIVIGQGWDQSRGWLGRGLAMGLLVLAGWGQWWQYREHLFPIQSAFATNSFGLTKAIRTITAADEVLIAHSPDWSSWLALYADRRMLTIPNAEMFHNPDRVESAVRLLEDESVPLVLMVREARNEAKWAADRIDDQGLWPTPLFVWEDQVAVYARADRYAEMHRRLSVDPPVGVVLAKPDALGPVESLASFPVDLHADEMSRLGFAPRLGSFLYGIAFKEDEEGLSLSTHAPLELHFDLPPDAGALEITYFMEPRMYAERDWDGITVLLDLVNPDRSLIPLHVDWVSPQGQPGNRTFRVALPAGRQSDQLAFRVLPGPRGSNAYDQAWLRRLDFIKADQTTSAK